MRLKPDQLDGALHKKLAPAYVISGDEPLQLQEAADAVRAAAKQAGFSGREVFFAESGFDWSSLLQAMDSPTLFGDRNVLDLRLNTAPDKRGAAVLSRYAARATQNDLLLISLPRLKPAEQKAAWFTGLDKIGIVVQVWPLEGTQLLDWLERRLQRRGLAADRASVQLLATLVEGNLLAASQEVEKLHALFGSGRIGNDDILQAVSNHARYDVFTLADAALAGQGARTTKVLAGLQAEGEATPVVLWALTRDIRLLLALHSAGEASLDAQLRHHKVVDKRKPLLQRALRRLSVSRLHDLLRLSSRIDAAIKGMAADDPWEGLLHIALGLAGCAVVTPDMLP